MQTGQVCRSGSLLAARLPCSHALARIPLRMLAAKRSVTAAPTRFARVRRILSVSSWPADCSPLQIANRFGVLMANPAWHPADTAFTASLTERLAMLSATLAGHVSIAAQHITRDVPVTSTRDLRILHMCFASADPDLIDNYRGLCIQFGADNMPAICDATARIIAAELDRRA